jgi:hypothetical protein
VACSPTSAKIQIPFASTAWGVVSLDERSCIKSPALSSCMDGLELTWWDVVLPCKPNGGISGVCKPTSPGLGFPSNLRLAIPRLCPDLASQDV